MSDDLVKRLRDMCGDNGILAIRDIYDHDVVEAADRIEKLETALLNIIATFGYGSSGGAYKNRYFNCLEIAKAELKHWGLKGQYSNYVKYVDDRKALEGKDD